MGVRLRPHPEIDVAEDVGALIGRNAVEMGRRAVAEMGAVSFARRDIVAWDGQESDPVAPTKPRGAPPHSSLD